MKSIFEIKFPIEQEAKDEVILHFAGKQGGGDSVFTYYWQCFAWAATIGFLRNERRELGRRTDPIFHLNTMRNNDGENVAEALVCMCIARAEEGVEILKDPEGAILRISEYANAGFDYIRTIMQNGENTYNDLQKVMDEIFSRELVSATE